MSEEQEQARSESDLDEEPTAAFRRWISALRWRFLGAGLIGALIGSAVICLIAGIPIFVNGNVDCKVQPK